MQTLALNIKPGKKIYFASDFHFGVPNHTISLEREKKVVAWLESIKSDAECVFLLGDLFDFWFEYNKTVPKGFVRFLGKLAELQDQGISIKIFTGNHDLWMFEYFPTEIGAQIFNDPILLKIGETKLLLGHGDGLGPGDKTYKLLKKVFTSSLCQWLFARIHPNLGITLAHRWSRNSRISNMKLEEKFQGEEREFLLAWCKELEKTEHHDYYVFGHRHLPLDLKVGDSSRYINLGEWVHFSPYAEFDGNKMEIKSFQLK
jgi:UDP-2,3-diacylglucosamine hydrolase